MQQCLVEHSHYIFHVQPVSSDLIMAAAAVITGYMLVAAPDEQR